MLLRCATVCYAAPHDRNAPIVQSTLWIILRGIRRYASIITVKHRILLLWLGPDTIINVHDPMQNLAQTRMFYKSDQTHLARTKGDLDDPTLFQLCSELHLCNKALCTYCPSAYILSSRLTQWQKPTSSILIYDLSYITGIYFCQ